MSRLLALGSEKGRSIVGRVEVVGGPNHVAAVADRECSANSYGCMARECQLLSWQWSSQFIPKGIHGGVAICGKPQPDRPPQPPALYIAFNGECLRPHDRSHHNVMLMCLCATCDRWSRLSVHSLPCTSVGEREHTQASLLANTRKHRSQLAITCRYTARSCRGPWG